MIHVLADQNLHKIEELLPPQCSLSLYNYSNGIPDLTDADALLVRSVTHINKETVPNLPKRLKFVGTGSSGMDHLDTDYLEHNHIHVASSNGCNSRAVAEYVMTSLLLWKEKHQPNRQIPKVGVVGVGKAGSAVIQLLQNFGVECVAYDPPRAEREADFKSAKLEEVLNCDILTFHIPLIKSGDHATFHWLDAEKLSHHSYKLIINAARGGIVDETVLLQKHKEGTVQQFVLDVWEGEPDFNNELAEQAFIATPHIAGYSEQAKIKATQFICDEMAEFFDLDAAKKDYNPSHKVEEIEDLNFTLSGLLARLNPILEYQKAMLDLAGRTDKGLHFQNLRNDWPYRYEYPSLKIHGELPEAFSKLKKLGIQSI